ncbi:MAG: 50S ribosomal protein L22 [Candidatus Peregrinibacteria bacterium Greene0416_62]|nr:MAG: 50S ribosomal protein L22 [Candidatus Peregrinibacteria bacterium Greene0416_62]
MKAYLHSVRIAPKKANLICKMIRGLTAADAMHILERTNKKAARLLEELLRSAMANASHNDKQDSQTLVIRSLIVNQGTAYHRGVPMARGRVRPMRKFMSHIELILGLPEDEAKKSQKKGDSASQKADTAVKKTSAAGKTSKTRSNKNSSASSDSSDSSASS